jgi:CelD/BcsL family acetyltransferase involved in cellulose biosynthesis
MNKPAIYQSERFSSFAELPADYVALLESAAESFDQTLVWYQSFTRHLLEPGERLELVGLRSAGRPIALLPLRAGNAKQGPLSVQRLQSLTNYYSALFGPVLAADAEPLAVAAAFAPALKSLVPRWTVLDLNPLSQEQPFLETLGQELRAGGCFVQPYFRFGNWYLDVAGRSYATYAETLPSRLRSTLKRKGKKLLAMPNASLRIVRDPAEVDAAMSGYESIYSLSWKQAEPYAPFIREIAQRFAERGWLRLGLVEIDGKPAAAQLWFTYGGTASIFKLAYDPQYGELSVGSILSQALMEYALDVDRVRVVDYLCGDDAYKRDWMSHRRERWGLRASPRFSLMGLTAAAQSLAGRVARRLRPSQAAAAAQPEGQAEVNSNAEPAAAETNKETAAAAAQNDTASKQGVAHVA